jgi:dTDP-4-dehydrorhamnose reductase
MNNIVIGVSGKIGKYYIKFSKNKNNIYLSRKFNKKKINKFNIFKDNIDNFYFKKNISSAILFTAISNPLICVKNKKLSFDVNIKLTKKIIDSFCTNNIYFVFFSSEYVYGGKKGVRYNERSITNSKMLYAKQKINIEKYIKKKTNNCAILRLAKTYGHEINDNTLFSSILNQYTKFKIKKFEIANDQYFKPLYVNDLIKIIDIFTKKKIKGTYNICGDQYFSRFDLISKMFNELSIKDVELSSCSIKKFDKGIYFPQYLNLSNNKIKKKIGFKFTKFEKILKKINV